VQSEIDSNLTDRGGIPTIWDRGRQAEDLKEHHSWLRNGMNYWDELRHVLRLLFNQNRGQASDFSRPNWAYEQAWLLGYEKALQDVYKYLPRPQETKQ
jgi:hypothetical protein